MTLWVPALSLRHVFGLVPGLRKAYYHRIAPDTAQLGEILADIHRAVPLGLHIMDGVEAMQGMGQTAGRPYRAGKILMAVDPLALDLAAIRMIGADPDRVLTLAAARERGIGEADPARVEIVGDYDRPPVLRGFRLPPYRKTGMGSGFLIGVIDFFRTRPVIIPKKCRDCGACSESCPAGAIDRKTKAIDYAACIECLCCHELCMHGAVELRKVNRVAGFLTKMMPK